LRIHALPPAHTPDKVRISFDGVGYMTIGEAHEPRDGRSASSARSRPID